jgi:hypothetical protein
MKPNEEETEHYKYFSSYHAIDKDGRPIIGKYVKKGDIIIGKVKRIPRSIRDKSFYKYKYQDRSKVYEELSPGGIEKVTVTYDVKGNKVMKVKIRILKKLHVGDKLASQCYSDDTDILTLDGWKNVSELSINDKVASINPENHQLSYEPVDALYEYDLKDTRMYHVSNKKVDLLVTPNHRMYFKKRSHYKLKESGFDTYEAKDIFNIQGRYKKNVSSIKIYDKNRELKYLEIDEYIGKKSGIVYPKVIIDTDVFLKFIGLYLSEGCITKKYNKSGGYCVEIAVCADKVRKMMDKEIIPHFPWKINKGKTKYSICNEQFWDIIYTKVSCELSQNKRIPQWIFRKMSMRQCNVLMRALLYGDGCFSGGVTRYYTISIGLRDDVQRLALHCGLSADWALKQKAGEGEHIWKGKLIKHNFDYWTITIVMKKNEPEVNRAGRGHKGKKGKNDEWIDNWTGKVYCCSTRFETLYVRRGGKSVFSQNSAQKGTNSFSMKSVDMPFSKTGDIPDIIFNPHGLITRMTIAQMIIMSLSIIAAERGIRMDGTPFNNININKDIIKVLKEMGYEESGKKTMFNGITGRRMESKIFMAPLYYQRLKHMIKSKVAARETGYYSHRTKQPGKGRQKKGGFKIGYMEKDALIAHGVSSILREKFFDHSDGFECFISEDTGHICVGNEDDHIYKDKKRNMKIAKVYLPWVFIMLYYLVETTGVNMEFILEDD